MTLSTVMVLPHLFRALDFCLKFSSFQVSSEYTQPTVRVLERVGERPLSHCQVLGMGVAWGISRPVEEERRGGTVDFAVDFPASLYCGA